MVNIRTAKKNEINQIIKLTNEVFREPNKMPPSMGKQFPLLFNKENAHNLFIAEDNGKIISHNGLKLTKILINGHPISYASMGAVCTHSAYRGQGIATKLLNDIFAYLKEKEISILTISGGRGLYTKNGADFTSGKTDYIINKNSVLKSTFNSSQYNVKYTENKIPGNVDKMAELYQKEPVRYQRSHFEFPQLLTAMPSVHDVPFSPHYFCISIVTADDNLLAYLIGYYQEKNKIAITEYAGERLAVIPGLKYLFSQKNVSQIKISVPSHDKNLITYLNKSIPEYSESYYEPTYIITNIKSLIKEVTPIIKERSPQKNLNIEKDSPIDISNKKELLHFLFDNFLRKDYGDRWKEILPLPLPCPQGLNYV